MKQSIALLACKSACILLSVFTLTGLAAPISHAASSYRTRKTSTQDVFEVSGEQELAQQVQRAGIVVALVYLPTCDACEAVIPQYANVANTETETGTGAPVTYLRVNFYTIPDVVSQFHITSVPTFILYKDGSAIETLNTSDITQLQNVLQQSL
jgi:thioredoxin-like negative regulator of GroEL